MFEIEVSRKKEEVNRKVNRTRRKKRMKRSQEEEKKIERAGRDFQMRTLSFRDSFIGCNYERFSYFR